MNLKINFVLIPVTHLTVGSGENQYIQSADIIQLKRKFYYEKKGRIPTTTCIPATTFKGLLRSSAVQVAHWIVDNKTYCVSVDTDKLSKCSGCIICNLFGANNKPSKLFCEDFFPSSSDFETQYFTQTSIDRTYGKSKRGALFTKEQIPPNVPFYATFEARDLTKKEELLLFFAFNNLKYCSFGNGNGLVELKIESIKGYSKDNEIILKLLKKLGYNE